MYIHSVTSANSKSQKLHFMNGSKSLRSLSSAPVRRRLLTFKVCKCARNKTTYEVLDLWSSDTLLELKQKVAHKLKIKLSLKTFFLEAYDEISDKWENIDDLNSSLTLHKTKLRHGSFLAIRNRTEESSNNPSPRKSSSHTNESHELTLRLCKKPMIAEDYILININSSCTFGQLRKHAYAQFDRSSENQYIYRRNDDVWKQMKPDMDHKTLRELSFETNQLISVVYDNVLILKSRMEKDILQLKVCKTKLDQTTFEYLTIRSTDTLEQLKEKIVSKFSVSWRLTDFYLEMFDEENKKWEKIDDSNSFLTLQEAKLRHHSFLTIQRRTETPLNDQSSGKPRSHIKESDELILKLCEKPMCRENHIPINVNRLSTLRELRTQVYEKFNERPNNRSLYKRDPDGWTELKINMNSRTLADLSFESNQFISIEMEKAVVNSNLSSLTDLLQLNICKGKRSQTNHDYLKIWSSDTLEQLKESIVSKFLISARLKDFFLELYDENTKQWETIDESNASLTINQLKLRNGSLLSVEYRTKKVSNGEALSESTSFSYENHYLWLKLCKKPMDMTDCETLTIESFANLGELREEVYAKLNQAPQNRSIYKWNNNRWEIFGFDMDAKTLRDLSFESKQFISLAIEKEETKSKFSSQTSLLKLKISKTKRSRTNYGYVDVWLSDTITTLKEKIAHYFPIDVPLKDFFLELYDENTKQWETIDESNASLTINQLKLRNDSLLNIEYSTNKVTNDRTLPASTFASYENHDLRLKLCKKPMDRTDCETLTIEYLCTLGVLREEAYVKLNKPPKNRPIYKWNQDTWVKFDSDIDNMTLCHLCFESYQYISIDYDEVASNSKPPAALCGLINLGNTCFMNSVFQCLNNIPKFTQSILELHDEQNAPIICEYKNLIKKMCSRKYEAIRPSSLLCNIQDSLPRYKTYRQQDAQEFMNHFLHLIHAELSMKNTIITNIFYGQIRSTVKCLGCAQAETNNEPFTFLPLPITNYNQRRVRYIKADGEQRLVSLEVDSSVITVGELVDCFLKQHEPKLTRKRIQAVQLVNHSVETVYDSGRSLRYIPEKELALIECSETTTRERHIWCQFIHRSTNTAFRPPIILTCPDENCSYLHLSEQIDQVLGHLCSITNAPMSTCDVYWLNRKRKPSKLNITTNPDLPYISGVHIEMTTKWVDIYKQHYRINHSNDNSRLANLLTDFFREDYLDDDYHCEKCSKLTVARHKSDLCLPLPHVLIIQLKRFTYDVNSNQKIDTYISFPLYDLDLDEYIVKDNTDIPEKNLQTKYDLVAVSNHTGGLTSGHYTAYSKNLQDGNWYSFDDDVVRQLNSDNNVVTKNAYILVYVQRTS
ncbi:unnamed protein product [Rotaria magnacalcarata]|uniref:ubiquitinyl hydrolase 1 n=7 Tax=Rotaria magnacalcarata TaxID=392030 RepID=A0A8S2KB23_9BILA|nr:unnamed protein product [Rotaria magnacalcarata]